MSGSENRSDEGRGPVQGSELVWSMISTLIAGPLVWGAIGYGVGALTGISALLPIGVVFGFLASLVWVLWGYKRSLDGVKPSGPVAPRSDDTPDRRGERP